MFTKAERERYNEDREKACNRLNLTRREYNWFRLRGEELRKIYENNCNGKEENTCFAETEIEKKAEELKLFVYFQTDPRGASLYLDIKPIPNNNYTQAVCIY